MMEFEPEVLIAGFWFTLGGSLALLVALVLLFVLSVVGAVLWWRFVEGPRQRWGYEHYRRAARDMHDHARIAIGDFVLSVRRDNDLHPTFTELQRHHLARLSAIRQTIEQPHMNADESEKGGRQDA